MGGNSGGAQSEPVARRATAADTGAVAALSAAAYAPYEIRLGYRPVPAVADYRAILARARVWVLQDPGGPLLGALVLMPAADHLLIYSIAIAPQHQRRGLGRQLMAQAETDARQLGLSEVRLYTNERMSENIAFYRLLGYRPCGRRPHPSREGSWLVDMAKGV